MDKHVTRFDLTAIGIITILVWLQVLIVVCSKGRSISSSAEQHLPLIATFSWINELSSVKIENGFSGVIL